MDGWALTFVALLGLISTSVYVWSYYYIDRDPTYRRFLGVLTSFVASIVLLVLFSTLFACLVGWDGLGVTSFLLVIYFKNRKSLGRGLITALTNRAGDAVYLVLLGVCLGQVGGLSHWQVVCILVLAMTKSAQYPFSSWLPAAIAAPTPVRALVHSRTLVTAGVYVLLRYNPHDFQWLLVAGSVTMLIAGLCACAEMDLKKIVALRTLSQLGVIIVALGLCLKELCFFHLLTHALFKALLFLCVGVYIHNTFGGQDYRSFASLAGAARGRSLLASVANLSLLGFPFLAGFFRKDLVLEGSYNRGVSYLRLVWFLIGVGLTTAYSLKMLALVVPYSGLTRRTQAGGGGWSASVKAPTSVLAVGAAWGGALLSVGATPAAVYGLDKAMPLAFVAVGWGLSVGVRGLQLAYFSSIWNLTPAVQRTAQWGVVGRHAAGLDLGAAAVSGGAGILAARLARNIAGAAPWLGAFWAASVVAG